ncbi:MAG: hypothetical protein M0017_10485 [Desulfobacteraceae bacterium]|nr:hypothetical protein [Desulfobacteraceae bacterium]
MNMRTTLIFTAAVILTAGYATNAFALTAPVSGSFLYDVYDIAVNKMQKGSAGFVGGVVGVVITAILAMRQMVVPAAGTLLGTALVVKADSIVTSLGAMIR